jgi:hypothetical protein
MAIEERIAGIATALGLAAPALAGDLPSLNIEDPVPDNPTWRGVTIYGTIDVGYTRSG